MSKRRKAGDIVWLAANSGFVGESNRLQAEIMPEDTPDPYPCFLCNDPDCREWLMLLTLPDPEASGKRHERCHVSECLMFDEPQGRDGDCNE